MARDPDVIIYPSGGTITMVNTIGLLPVPQHGTLEWYNDMIYFTVGSVRKKLLFVGEGSTGSIGSKVLKDL